jgi:hypothetical protein
MPGSDQDALGSADGLSAGMLSAGELLSAGALAAGLSAGVLDTGSLDTGSLDTGVVLEFGDAVAAGVLQAATAPPRLAASARASRIRFVTGNLRCRGR